MQNKSLIRKVIYALAICVLLIPISLISQPTVLNSKGEFEEGGMLSRLRRQYNISQAELGEIDPASESMKLATLGMRGVAANILWTKANDYKKKEDWDNLSATLNQIIKLQPNFIKVWEFQAHNLSYNVSVEFDNYEHRYHWVKKGINFLTDGTRYNRDEPILLWNLGWYTGHKMGKADEKLQFRRLFRKDTDFHNFLANYVPIDDPDARGREGPDNWLVGRLWFLEGQTAVDEKGKLLRGKSPLIFFSDAPMARMNYAMAIEEEGYLDERAQIAWLKAGNEWKSYGDRPIPTSWGHDIRLNDREQIEGEAAKLIKELDEIAPGVREELTAEKRSKLAAAEIEALDTPAEKRSPEQHELAYQAESRAKVTHAEVAGEAPPANREKATRLAVQIENLKTLADRIERYREIVNFAYWRTRCEVEQTDTAIAARDLIFRAKEKQKKAELDEARKLYEDSFENWAKIYEQHPSLLEDVTAEDVVEYVEDYIRLLGQLDDNLSEDFVLMNLLEVHNKVPADLKAAQPKQESEPDSAESAESQIQPPVPDGSAPAPESQEPGNRSDTESRPGEAPRPPAPDAAPPAPEEAEDLE